MAIYMQYEGIDGDVTEEHHKKWIPLGSVSFACNRTATTKVGAGADRQGAGVSINEITVSKPFDAASPHLFTASVVGFGKNVKIHITRTGAGEQINFLE